MKLMVLVPNEYIIIFSKYLVNTQISDLLKFRIYIYIFIFNISKVMSNNLSEIRIF